MREPYEWKFKALSDVWTGDAEGKCDSLIYTGILGSIRWWFEVLVRGLGGNACDPSETKCDGLVHCVVCELFGCTGRSRKFRFDVLYLDKEAKAAQIKKTQIKKNDEFTMRFMPLLPIKNEEWSLVETTLRLISCYGAIGGKTVFKPTYETGRLDEIHHRDYGMIDLISDVQIPALKDDLVSYVNQGQWANVQQDQFEWASLTYFWCINGHCLARQNPVHSTFNMFINTPEEKRNSKSGDSWLAGKAGTEAASKKVFSFKNPPRTYGFIYPIADTYTAVQDQLEIIWGIPINTNFKNVDDILFSLFPRPEDSHDI